MRKVFKVFVNDLKKIAKNPVALLIVIGLCFIPSLYAWVNIKACWDPYANTGNLPVAIVNNDKGANFNDTTINVGDEVIKKLKDNHSIGWKFVDSWQGNYGLNEGKYYALIEIPSDFSQNLTTLVTSNPQKPDIIYKANEKANAIANKITSVAKDKLTNEIRTNFIETVNKEIFTALNHFGKDLEINKPTILQLKDTLNASEEQLNTIKTYIQNANDSSKGLQNYLGQVKNDLPGVTNQINNLQNVAQSSKTLITETSQTLNSVLNSLKTNMTQMQVLNQKVQMLISRIKGLNFDTVSSSDINSLIDEAQGTIDVLNSTLDSIVESLNGIRIPSIKEKAQEVINLVKKAQSSLANEKAELEKLRNMPQNKDNKEEITKVLNTISDLSNTVSNTLSSISNNFYTGVLGNTGGALADGTDNINTILESTKAIVPQLNALATYGIATGDVANKQAESLTGKLTDFENKINELKDKTSGLNEETLNDIIRIMEKNPDEMASFISSPIEVKKEEVYDSSIFGVALTPFYTVLAIWVGVLLMSALFNTSGEEYIDGEKMNLVQRHFGKLLTFLLIAFIQSTIVTVGDKIVLGVKPENMMLLLGFAWLSAFTFTMIIFNLVALFGNVGKAIAVVIMVFQIAGAGGIYPIQTNPEIFQVLQPLWPFTYAIDGFREAISGPVWSSVSHDVKALLIFSFVFLVLSILKKPLHKLNEGMEHKFKEAGI